MWKKMSLDMEKKEQGNNEEKKEKVTKIAINERLQKNWIWKRRLKKVILKNGEKDKKNNREYEEGEKKGKGRWMIMKECEKNEYENECERKWKIKM